MPQSFWDTDEHKTFKSFCDWMDANWFDWDKKTQRKNQEKFRSGCRKMTALALSWGLEFTEPRLKCLDANQVKWVDFDVEGVEKIGLWTGRNTKIDGYSVFNIFWFRKLTKGVSKERAKFIIKLLVEFEGEPYDESDYQEDN